MILTSIKFILFFATIALLGYGGAKNALAQESQSVLYVPLIGITSVPAPLSLPRGAGNVTYNYAVKNFLSEAALTDVEVTDNNCSPVKFTEGDDNGDSKLDSSETWRYSCSKALSTTTKSIATATGNANNLNASHKAYVTVVVGSGTPPPLVSIVNITKIASPLSLPSEGGNITFTYKVNNPGEVPLSNVTVTDDSCAPMSGKLGDTNGNNLLDIQEVWIFTCRTSLMETTTNTARVMAEANGLRAIGETTLTVKINPTLESSPTLFDVEITPEEGGSTVANAKIIVWAILFVILSALSTFFFLTKKSTLRKSENN